MCNERARPDRTMQVHDPEPGHISGIRLRPCRDPSRMENLRLQVEVAGLSDALDLPSCFPSVAM